ncbi:DUF960 domain-containing protein [Streptococcus dysgalactiae]|nr:DUF960 domain-containing protein [Streptococcus dysgalactiae]
MAFQKAKERYASFGVATSLPLYPRTIYVVDNSGIETILLPHEIN